MRRSRIKAKLKQDQPALIVTVHLTDPSVHELTSLMGFDGIWMDMEHHAYSLETATGLMRAARVGTSDIIARPAKGEFMRMQRMLEAGAQGIMYPRCDHAEEAAEVVNWAKFPPMGRRGWGGLSPDIAYGAVSTGQYIQEANEQTLVIIQIEQPHSVDRAGQIAAVDGVDVLFLGPGDLSIQSGIPGRFDHEVIRDAMQRISQAARKHGKHWGCPSGSLEQTQRLLEMGARFICHQADILMIKNGLEKIQQEFSPLGFRFDNRLKGQQSSGEPLG